MKTIVLSIAGALALGTMMLVWARAFAQRQETERIQINSQNGIDSLEKIRLGGVDQWIQIRGRDRSKPLLLFLHGGPGFSEMPFAHLNAALADDFVVVEWDQRGTGKSFSSGIPASSMTVEQIVTDTHELAELLLRRFGGPKLFLVAHSWGTIIGARVVARYPELFHAYIAISQVANPPESERLMYRFALEETRKSGATKGEAKLRQIGLPPYKDVRDYNTMNRWIHRFSDTQYSEMSPLRFAALAFVSPDYSWLDLFRLWRGFRFSFGCLWREAFAVNFFTEIPRLDVPAYFFLGRHDHTSTVSAQTAKDYFEALDAPAGKQLVWFEHSGHWPHLNEPQKYRDQLRNILQAKHP